MIRYVGSFRVRQTHNYATARPEMCAPRETSVDLRFLTGDDARYATGREVAQFEIPTARGKIYLSSQELRAFADLMDATTD